MHLQDTPSALGFHMPAEWEPHTQFWMGWLCVIRYCYCRCCLFGLLWELRLMLRDRNVGIIGETVPFMPNKCLPRQRLRSPNLREKPFEWENARSQLPVNVKVVEISANDAWFRDIRPTFVVRRKTANDAEHRIAGIDWSFNSWGGLEDGCYCDWSLDTFVAKKILEVERIPRFSHSMVLEGGSIHVDGEGTCLTTEECLLNKNRNPHLNKNQIEDELKAYLGVRKVIWLPRGLYEIGGEPAGKIVFGVFGEVVTKTVENFRVLLEIEEVDTDEHYTPKIM